MFRPLGVNIGLRYGFSQRSFIAQVSSLAIFGLALSTAVLILVLSVVNGFERELQTRLFGIMPHVTLRARVQQSEDVAQLETLRSLPGVAGAASFLQGPVLLANDASVSGAMLTGIDPESYSNVSELHRYVDAGVLERLSASRFGLLLGKGLARELGVGAGGQVTVVLPEGSVSPLGVHPRQRRFEVIGLIDSESEFDNSAAFTLIRSAQKMFRAADDIHGYQLRLHELFEAEEIGRAANIALGRGYFSTSWMRTHGTLYHAIGLQKLTMFVLLSFLVGVAAFNLVSTLVMVVNERRADVAVLRTLGTSTSVVMVAFITLGLVIGLLGVVLGVIAGIALGALLESGFAWLTETFDLNLLSQYFVNYLPVDTRASDILKVSAIALLLCFLSAIYPAWRAARLLPTRILKYE